MGSKNGVEEKRREWSRVMGDGNGGDPAEGSSSVGGPPGKNDTLRGLLSLIIRTKRIRFSEASRALDLDIKEIESIISVLQKKKLVSISNPSSIDPTIEASEFLLKRIKERGEKKKASASSVNVDAVKRQLLSQRDELLKKTKELEEEYKKRVELEERLRNVEKQLGSEVSEKEKLEELRQQLMKEREDRIRLEEKLKHEHEHLTEQENELKKRERELVEMEVELKKKQGKIAEEEEELELLYGDEKELNEKRLRVKKELDDMRRMSQEAAKKDETLGEKEKKIGEEEESVKRMEFSLKSREDGVERREKNVIKKEETIKHKEDELEEKERRIKDGEKELQKKATILRRIKDKIVKEREEVASKEELIKKEAEALMSENKQIEKKLIEESDQLKKRTEELKSLIKGEIVKLSTEEAETLDKGDSFETPWTKKPPLPPAGDGGPGDEDLFTKQVTKEIEDIRGLRKKPGNDAGIPEEVVEPDDFWVQPPEEPPPMPPAPPAQKPADEKPNEGVDYEAPVKPATIVKVERPVAPDVLKNELSVKESLERRDQLAMRESALEEQLSQFSEVGKKTKEDLLKIVAADPGIKIEDAIKKLGEERKTVEGWTQQLAADGILEVKRKLIGGATLELVKGAAEKVKTQKDDEEIGRIKDELKRMRGE
jgi:hypothetical protein